MIPDHILEELVIDQKTNFLSKETGIIRKIDFKKYIRSPQITVISGIRRSGKSTLLRQFSEFFKEYHYINFDDERLIDFTVKDFAALTTVLLKISRAKTIIMDEIQNIKSWERFVRRIHDEGYKVFITGSNAKLLSSELATHLTGRYQKIELFPFSFSEFLKFKKIDYNKSGSVRKAEILNSFDYYLRNGGFPEFIKFKDEEYLKRIYNDIIYRDIIARFGIREVQSFKKLSHYIFSNFTTEISYNSIKNLLEMKSSISVHNYISFLEETYLAFELYRFDYSLKKMHRSNRKIYVIDNGIRNAVSFQFSQDKGKFLENLIFIELKRRGKNIYFFKGKGECDFLVEEKGKMLWAIQVCFDLSFENKTREINGILESRDSLKIKNGLIITYNQEDEIHISKRYAIKVLPAWKWLLET